MMANRFKAGDHVRWNSEAGHVTGRIIRLHTNDTEYAFVEGIDQSFDVKTRGEIRHVGVHAADLGTAPLLNRDRVAFTSYWPEADRGEGAGFVVVVD
jgi:hypothetical protein